MKVRHAIYCKKCLETIESKNERDFKMCPCESIGIDGSRILGSVSDMEDRSMYCAFIRKKKIWLPESAIKDIFP